MHMRLSIPDHISWTSKRSQQLPKGVTASISGLNDDGVVIRLFNLNKRSVSIPKGTPLVLVQLSTDSRSAHVSAPVGGGGDDSRSKKSVRFDSRHPETQEIEATGKCLPVPSRDRLQPASAPTLLVDQTRSVHSAALACIRAWKMRAIVDDATPPVSFLFLSNNGLRLVQPYIWGPLDDVHQFGGRIKHSRKITWEDAMRNYPPSQWTFWFVFDSSFSKPSKCQDTWKEEKVHGVTYHIRQHRDLRNQAFRPSSALQKARHMAPWCYSFRQYTNGTSCLTLEPWCSHERVSPGDWIGFTAFVEQKTAAAVTSSGSIAAAAASQNVFSICRSIMADTGCADDLAPESIVNMMRHLCEQNNRAYGTANGQALSTSKLTTSLPPLGDELTLNILADTPTVFSVGRRCMERGFTFLWIHDKTP